MGAAAVELLRALNFAARKHAGQVRKGVVALPYINHLAEVADLLARATHIDFRLDVCPMR